jgi:SAM-dependent methyltransferase
MSSADVSRWSTPGTVSGFATSPPNPVLMECAARELARAPGGRVLDIGCGAARNAVPLAALGWDVVGVDLSWPMLAAAAERAVREGVRSRVHLVHAAADALPVADRTADLVVAHGIWNLSASSAEFRRAVAEAARAARPDACLFVFTFSRNTLSPDAEPVAGEPFVFTQFSGQPQCFLTDAQLVDELGAAGFEPEASVPMTEYNRHDRGMLGGGPPVIYEAAFRRV